MWNFYTPTRTTFGKGSLQKIVEEFATFQGKQPLIIASPRTLATKEVEALCENLQRARVTYSISTQVAPEAPVELVQQIYNDYRNSKCDSIIAIGGGSTIDLAKAASILTTNSGDIEDYYGIHTVPNPTVPKILVPTTSGTGSEATNISVLANKAAKSKKGIVSHFLFADWVVLDPELTYSVPRDVSLTTGLDAFCQCLEAFTSKGGSPLVDMYGLKGMELISKNLSKALEGDIQAQDVMCFAAYLSGIVISGGNSGTNIGHALGNTLGGMYGTAHGLSVSAVLEQGILFNSADRSYQTRLDEIKQSIGLDVLQFLSTIQSQFGIPRLTQLSVKENDIPQIAQRVMSDQKRLLVNNRREVLQTDVEKILYSSL